MRKAMVVMLLAATMLPATALARSQDKPGTERRPITDTSVSAADVVTTPITDLNLDKDEIPTVLLLAQEHPYDISKTRRCGQIVAAVSELDAILGSDLDLPQKDAERISVGKIGQSVVGSFIPFRSILRELTGANEQQRKVAAAVQAGMARRAFLKGYGQAHGCRYPGRPVTPAVLATLAAGDPPQSAAPAR